MDENQQAVLGLTCMAIVWLGPIPLAAWTLKRKGHAPQWAWLGLLPIVGLIVLLVALLLADKPASTSTSSETPGAPRARAQYEKGMRDLGNGLIALGALWMLGSAMVLLTDVPRVFGLSLGIMAVLIIACGILARRLHAWVNYVNAVFACLLLAGNLHTISIHGKGPEPPPGSQTGSCLGFVIAAALLYYSVNNIQKLRRAKAEGSTP